VNKAALLAECMRLSPDERLDLIGDLWDSLEPCDLPPLTDDQIEELERRLAYYHANPDSAVSLEDFVASLRAKRVQ
jgi:putative addiction module component (TIGR02574 family)